MFHKKRFDLFHSERGQHPERHHLPSHPSNLGTQYVRVHRDPDVAEIQPLTHSSPPTAHIIKEDYPCADVLTLQPFTRTRACTASPLTSFVLVLLQKPWPSPPLTSISGEAWASPPYVLPSFKTTARTFSAHMLANREPIRPDQDAWPNASRPARAKMGFHPKDRKNNIEQLMLLLRWRSRYGKTDRRSFRKVDRIRTHPECLIPQLRFLDMWFGAL